MLIRWAVGAVLGVVLIVGGVVFIGVHPSLNIHTRDCTVTESFAETQRRDNAFTNIRTKECGTIIAGSSTALASAASENCFEAMVAPGAVYRITTGGFEVLFGLLQQRLRQADLVSVSEESTCDVGTSYVELPVHKR